MIKISKTQQDLLDWMRSNGSIRVTMWGGRVHSSNIPQGHRLTTLQRLSKLGLCTERQGNGLSTIYTLREQPK